MKTYTVSVDDLYTIYLAGFNHGFNETLPLKVGVEFAFLKLLKGEPPVDDTTYNLNIKENGKDI